MRRGIGGGRECSGEIPQLRAGDAGRVAGGALDLQHQAGAIRGAEDE